MELISFIPLRLFRFVCFCLFASLFILLVAIVTASWMKVVPPLLLRLVAVSLSQCPCRDVLVAVSLSRCRWKVILFFFRSLIEARDSLNRSRLYVFYLYLMASVYYILTQILQQIQPPFFSYDIKIVLVKNVCVSSDFRMPNSTLKWHHHHHHYNYQYFFYEIVVAKITRVPVYLL